MSRRGSCIRWAAAAAVAAVHVLALLTWPTGNERRRAPADPARVGVRLIAPTPPRPPLAPPAVAARPRARSAAIRRVPPAMTPTPAPAPAPAPTLPPVAAAAAVDDDAAAPPGDAASAAPLPSLLDGDATRRAIRAAARDPGLAARAERFDAPAATRDARLGAEIARGARGDCLKGEYAGAGMGLLSLPFLAAAALRDRCRR